MAWVERTRRAYHLIAAGVGFSSTYRQGMGGRWNDCVRPDLFSLDAWRFQPEPSSTEHPRTRHRCFGESRIGSGARLVRDNRANRTVHCELRAPSIARDLSRG